MDLFDRSLLEHLAVDDLLNSTIQKFNDDLHKSVLHARPLKSDDYGMGLLLFSGFIDKFRLLRFIETTDKGWLGWKV